jgi:argininosuccinate lyase
MAKKLWGGRFGKKTDSLVEEFTKSIQFDHKLAESDILGSILHVGVLLRAGYLTAAEHKKLANALKSMLAGVMQGDFRFDKNCEDIHTNIQNALSKKCGVLALKLHTARSRNDQAAFATKVYCKLSALSVEACIKKLTAALGQVSQKNKQLIIPGFTHLQHAQPVCLKHYLQAYQKMLQRDMLRLKNASAGIAIAFGAGALAGTPIEARLYCLKAAGLLKDSPLSGLKISAVANSLDAVSDRDFVIEIISALSILAMHLSRLAEDLIIWSSKEFGFVEIDDAFCTGSSLMPQKKNPDVLELARGYAGRLYGNLVSVLTMMKGLPLTYNRDMQLDKEPLFNSFEIASSELKVLTGLIETLKFNENKIKGQLKDESLYATDIVYYLVDREIPFKEAHTIVGKLVKYSIDNEIQIKDMPEDKLKQFSKKFAKKEVVRLFDPLVSVSSKKSIKR